MDLDSYVKELSLRGEQQNEFQTYKFVATLIDTVSTFHRHRWAHNDLKLDNFGMTLDNRIVLIDFGSAVDLSSLSESERLQKECADWEMMLPVLGSLHRRTLRIADKTVPMFSDFALAEGFPLRLQHGDSDFV